MNIGNQISTIRKEQKLTQEQFGSLSHVTEKSIIDFLRVQALELLYLACFHPIPYAEL